MATIRFLLQGFTAATHLKEMRRLLACPNPERFLFGVAFVNRAGAERLAQEIGSTSVPIDFFAGIRNNTTTRQGLERLLEAGIKLHVVDTGAENLLFHPKIYLAHGTQEARAIVGSSNLTLGGLHNNIEASMSLDLDIAAKADRKLVQTIESSFDSLLSEHPEHVFTICRVEDLRSLQSQGRLLDESQTFRPRALPKSVQAETDPLRRLQLKLPPIRQTIPHAAASKPLGTHARPASMALMWRSKPLTRRDLTIPDNISTHATGSINLDKGMLEDHVDHRHYFRDSVFSQLSWKPAGPTVDEAYADFALVIGKIDYGIFRLRIAHTTSTSSAAYRQKNAMTRLSWGSARDHVAKDSLLGRTLSLYHTFAADPSFLLEID